jgi:pimeloyl-ACP methyl ester carboxylesterase
MAVSAATTSWRCSIIQGDSAIFVGMVPPALKLVLLPGMDGTGSLFADFVDALPKSFNAVTVRYPTEQCLSYSDLEDLVRAACPISGPFVLLAESFSTPLAIKYAATNPNNLEGVVLCAGFATSPVRGWRRFLGSLLAPLVFHIPIMRLITKTGGPAFLRDFTLGVPYPSRRLLARGWAQGRDHLVAHPVGKRSRQGWATCDLSRRCPFGWNRRSWL